MSEAKRLFLITGALLAAILCPLRGFSGEVVTRFDDMILETGPEGNKQWRRANVAQVAKNLPWVTQSVSVRDFGAKGDGVTDNHTAITNAITYALQNSIGTIQFPDDPTLAAR